MSTIIETCNGLSDADCAYEVTVVCAASPNDCGIYYQFFSYADLQLLMVTTVTVLLPLVAIRIAKKVWMPSI